MFASESGQTSKPRVSFKERQRQLREHALLDATLELLISKGYAAMTLDDVIEAVGISKPTLYQHFKSKEELAVSVATRAVREAIRYIQHLDSKLPVKQRLDMVLAWFFNKRYAEPGLRFSDFCQYLRSPFAGRESDFTHAEQELLQLIEGLIVEGQNLGIVRPEIPPCILTQMMMCTIRDEGFDRLVASGDVSPDHLRAAALKILLN